MNPVAMTIINPRKEYWPSRGSNQQPPVLKSATLLTELWARFIILWEDLGLAGAQTSNPIFFRTHMSELQNINQVYLSVDDCIIIHVHLSLPHDIFISYSWSTLHPKYKCVCSIDRQTDRGQHWKKWHFFSFFYLKNDILMFYPLEIKLFYYYYYYYVHEPCSWPTVLYELVEKVF